MVQAHTPPAHLSQDFPLLLAFLIVTSPSSSQLSSCGPVKLCSDNPAAQRQLKTGRTSVYSSPQVPKRCNITPCLEWKTEVQAERSSP